MPYNGSLCATSQPDWSAFREPSYGHGLLTFLNSTTAHWEWNRNLDSEAVTGDSMYIIRQLHCANKAVIGADMLRQQANDSEVTIVR